MKTLTEIKEEVGEKEYNKMELKAELELYNHPEFWERANAYHSVIYQEIVRQYFYKTRKERINKEIKRKERGYFQI